MAARPRSPGKPVAGAGAGGQVDGVFGPGLRPADSCSGCGGTNAGRVVSPVGSRHSSCPPVLGGSFRKYPEDGVRSELVCVALCRPSRAQ